MVTIKKNKGIIFSLLILLLLAILSLYFHIDIKIIINSISFNRNYEFFQELEEKINSSNFSTLEKELNNREYLKAITSRLKIRVYSIDFSKGTDNRIIYISTEPNFDYTGFMYFSNSEKLSCMLSKTNEILKENENIRLSVKQLNKHWVYYIKSEKGVPLDVLYRAKAIFDCM